MRLEWRPRDVDRVSRWAAVAGDGTTVRPAARTSLSIQVLFREPGPRQRLLELVDLHGAVPGRHRCAGERRVAGVVTAEASTGVADGAGRCALMPVREADDRAVV
ncbi:MAG: hypothetical protein ACRDYA_19380 [Egibacteraceae bacterium]